MSLPVQPLRHRLSLDVVTQDLLGCNLGILGLSRPLHPSPRESFPLESRGSSVKDKHGSDLVEQKFANPVIKTKEVGISYTVALLVSEPPNGLIEPDGDVNCEYLVVERLHWDRLPYRVQQCPEAENSHLLT